MSEQNKALARQAIEALDRNSGPVLDLYTADAQTFMQGDPPFDMATYKRFSGEFFAAFPDLVHNVDEVTAEGDRVVLQITVTGTHKGTFEGIAATGVSIRYPSMVTYRIRDGKIASTRAVFDTLALLRQLGAERLPDA
jgi:steroid delta-isomerase-like uncharacterized protein